MNERTEEYWNNHSEDYFKNYGKTYSVIKNDPTKAFPAKVYNEIKNIFPNLQGKNVLVPSSGDNGAAFGFYLLGAKVTSCDLSKNQLKNAEKIAKQNNWHIEFKCSDSMTLDNVKDENYDLVYTSNGVHVWINNLNILYKTFRKKIKPDGYYIFFETHPMIRPFDDSGNEIKIVKLYEDIGPFHDPPNYFWRIEDYFNALLENKFILMKYMDIKANISDVMCHNWFYRTYEELEKDNGDKFNWKINPWAALPQWIGMALKKNT
jgi:SAM-dependent methyltransferase